MGAAAALTVGAALGGCGTNATPTFGSATSYRQLLRPIYRVPRRHHSAHRIQSSRPVADFWNPQPRLVDLVGFDPAALAPKPRHAVCGRVRAAVRQHRRDWGTLRAMGAVGRRCYTAAIRLIAATSEMGGTWISSGAEWWPTVAVMSGSWPLVAIVSAR